jgi:hypothetical protein
MAYHQPFDLYYWFVNVFAGNITMFLAIAFFVIASLTAMFRMPTIIVGVFFALFIIMLSVITGTLNILVLLIIGLIVGWVFTRFLK